MAKTSGSTAWATRRLEAAWLPARRSQAAEVADILWTCSSVELYELLVLQRGWTCPEFAEYV